MRPPAARPALSGRRALVTGGLGFIGSHVVRRLLDAGCAVAVIDSLDPACGGNAFNLEGVLHRVAFRRADVGAPGAVDDLLDGVDHVFHLAGRVSHVDSMADPAGDLDANARATLCLLEACRRRAPEAVVVLASTRQVYGRPEHLPLHESHSCRPSDVNGVSKWAAEEYCRVYARAYGTRSAILRLTNTYGPGQLVKHPRLGVLGWFLRLAVEGKCIDVMGDGEQLRDLNHVDDVVEALLAAAVAPEAWGQTYNLGGAEPVSLADLAALLVELAGHGSWQLVPFPADRARIDVGSAFADAGAIREALGWVPRMPLREGLERTLRYYQQHLPRYL